LHPTQKTCHTTALIAPTHLECITVEELGCPQIAFVLKPLWLEELGIGGEQHVKQRPRGGVLQQYRRHT
jgi:hypothetical protein